jgi:hypothetical protein
MTDCSGNGDGNSDSQDGVRHGQCIDVAVTEKEQARGQAPEQSDRRKNGAGQMRGGEDHRGREGREFWVGKQAQKARKKEALEQELLHEGPDDIAHIGPDEEKRSGGNVQRSQPDGEGNGDGGDQQRRAHNPERTKKVFPAQSHGLQALEGD